MSTTRIQLRRATAAEWTTANPVLALGEMGLESDTGNAKAGDGETAWNVLEYQRFVPRLVTQVIAPQGETLCTSLAIDPDEALAMAVDWQLAMIGGCVRGHNYFVTAVDADGAPINASWGGEGPFTAGLFTLGQFSGVQLVDGMLVPVFASGVSVETVLQATVWALPRPASLPASDCPTPVDYTCDTDCEALATDCGRGACQTWQGENCP